MHLKRIKHKYHFVQVQDSVKWCLNTQGQLTLKWTVCSIPAWDFKATFQEIGTGINMINGHNLPWRQGKLNGVTRNGVWFLCLTILVCFSTNKRVSKLGTHQDNLFLQIALHLLFLMSFPCASQLFIILSKTCIDDRRMKEQFEHINVIFCAYIYQAAATPSSSVASLHSVSGTSPSMTI